MMSAKFYRRTILACLWLLFLAVIYGKNRKTQIEWEMQLVENWVGSLKEDQEFQQVRSRIFVREFTSQGSEVKREHNKKFMRDAINQAMKGDEE